MLTHMEKVLWSDICYFLFHEAGCLDNIQKKIGMENLVSFGKDILLDSFKNLSMRLLFVTAFSTCTNYDFGYLVYLLVISNTYVVLIILESLLQYLTVFNFWVSTPVKWYVGRYFKCIFHISYEKAQYLGCFHKREN